MILSALVCYCNLDTEQENYDLGELLSLWDSILRGHQQNWKLGNCKLQNIQAPGSGEKHEQMLLPKSGMGKLLRVDREFLLPTVGMPWYAHTMQHPRYRTVYKLSTIWKHYSSAFILLAGFGFGVEDLILGLGIGLKFVLY